MCTNGTATYVAKIAQGLESPSSRYGVDIGRPETIHSAGLHGITIHVTLPTSIRLPGMQNYRMTVGRVDLDDDGRIYVSNYGLGSDVYSSKPMREFEVPVASPEFANTLKQLFASWVELKLKKDWSHLHYLSIIYGK